jgi:thymidylate synthase (FAD)
MTGRIEVADLSDAGAPLCGYTKLLDHGYIEYIEHWGGDYRIVEAARMSTNKGFKGWGSHCRWCGISRAHAQANHSDGCVSQDFDEENSRIVYGAPRSHDFVPGDEKLLRYLYENKHSTPFEMAGLIVQVKAPIFVFRQWQRHRTQAYNELSARYTPVPNEFYIPTVERLMMDGGTNKQAQGKKALTREEAQAFIGGLKEAYRDQAAFYTAAHVMGVPNELARLSMPVGQYSVMRTSANLRNWLAFLTLRMDEHAQWETRQYANVVGSLISSLFPRTWELFMEGREV